MSELDKLHDAIERQSEIIAALRNQIATQAAQIRQLEAQLAATLTTIETACDGRTYSEGCKP